MTDDFRRFVSVTDRFVSELGPIIQGQVIPKEVDSKFDNIIRAMRYIQIKVGLDFALAPT